MSINSKHYRKQEMTWNTRTRNRRGYLQILWIGLIRKLNKVSPLHSVLSIHLSVKALKVATLPRRSNISIAFGWFAQ